MLLRDVGTMVDSMKLQDLARLGAHLNSMDLFELEGNEFQVIRQITDRLLASISDLEERTIYDLIRAKNVGKSQGFQRLYE